MVKIEFEVSELIAKFFKVENIKGHFGEEYTPEMILEDALRDSIKLWADWTLEEEVEWMEKEEK